MLRSVFRFCWKVGAFLLVELERKVGTGLAVCLDITAMTREQQQSTRELETSIHKFLQSYGWVRDGSYWRHPSIRNSGRFTDWDALSETRAKPTLGWSQLKGVSQ